MTTLTLEPELPPLPIGHQGMAPSPAPRMAAAELAPAQEEARRQISTPAEIVAAAEAELAQADSDAARAVQAQSKMGTVIPPPPRSETAPALEQPVPPMSPRTAAVFSPRAAATMSPRGGGRVALGRAARQMTAARALGGKVMDKSMDMSMVPVRTAKGSEALSSAEEQFRLSLTETRKGELNSSGLPLGSYEPPGSSGANSLPPMNATAAGSLNGSERSALEAAVLERTKHLNQLFEVQVKKQYEAMKTEVAKLAKAHQKDVAGLDARFKQKMSGLAARFAQVEAEEARIANVEAAHRELQEEYKTLQAQLEEELAKLAAQEEATRNRDAQLEAMAKEAAEEKARQAEAAAEAERRRQEAEADKKQMEGVIASLEKTLDRKKADLLTMQKRLVTAKSTYDGEVERKQLEVSELESSLNQLQVCAGRALPSLPTAPVPSPSLSLRLASVSRPSLLETQRSLPTALGARLACHSTTQVACRRSRGRCRSRFSGARPT